MHYTAVEWDICQQDWDHVCSKCECTPSGRLSMARGQKCFKRQWSILIGLFSNFFPDPFSLPAVLSEESMTGKFCKGYVPELTTWATLFRATWSNEISCPLWLANTDSKNSIARDWVIWTTVSPLSITSSTDTCSIRLFDAWSFCVSSFSNKLMLSISWGIPLWCVPSTYRTISKIHTIQLNLAYLCFYCGSFRQFYLREVWKGMAGSTLGENCPTPIRSLPLPTILA